MGIMIGDLLKQWKYKIKSKIHQNKVTISEVEDGPFKVEYFNDKTHTENEKYKEDDLDARDFALEESLKGNEVEVWQLRYIYKP